jgi:hypothetical protein
VLREGEKYHFQKGGGVGEGINIVFGQKYRPLGFSAKQTESEMRGGGDKRKGK